MIVELTGAKALGLQADYFCAFEFTAQTYSTVITVVHRFDFVVLAWILVL